MTKRLIEVDVPVSTAERWRAAAAVARMSLSDYIENKIKAATAHPIRLTLSLHAAEAAWLESQSEPVDSVIESLVSTA